MRNYYTDTSHRSFLFRFFDLVSLAKLKENNFVPTQADEMAPSDEKQALEFYEDVLISAGKIAAEDLEPLARSTDRNGVRLENGTVVLAESMVKSLEILKDSGIHFVTLSRNWGGYQVPSLVNVMITELLSQADASIMPYYALQDLAVLIERFGSDEQKREYLPGFVSKGWTAAMTLTEPEAGSDLLAIRSSAIANVAQNTWVLNGTKRFITHPDADVHLILARAQGEDPESSKLTLFLYRKEDGLIIRRLEEKLGIHGSPTGEIEYRNVPCQPLGNPSLGMSKYAASMLNSARISVGAQAVGIAQAALDKAKAYAAERRQFGKSILEFPAIWDMLYRAQIELEACRNLLYRTSFYLSKLEGYEESAESHNEKETTRLRKLVACLVPLTKYSASEIGQSICSQALQVLGGAGYTAEFDLERHYRDIRITSIYEGTSQIQAQAAIPGILYGTLDELWREMIGEVDPSKENADQARALFAVVDSWKATLVHVRSKNRSFLDYHMKSIVEASLVVHFSVTLFEESRFSEVKKNHFEKYCFEKLPFVSTVEQILKSNYSSKIEDYLSQAEVERVR